MEYRIEHYKNCERFNEQYQSIYQFLLKAGCWITTSIFIGDVLNDLSNPLVYCLPDGYTMCPREFAADPWQYQLVIHRGFDNDGTPEKWDAELLKRIPHANDALKTFAIADCEYCAHCGLWYTTGDTAYVEPVATVPEHRKHGLAKAVVYEACSRAHALGAKRAIVLSDQAFYSRIGFTHSSEVYDWEHADSD